jgi:O-antigen/teichoic acid export membrane protein
LALSMSTDLGIVALTKKIMSGGAIVFALVVVSAALRYLAQILLARWTGASEYGLFTYVVALVENMALIAGLGLSTAAVRFLPKYLQEEKSDFFKGYVWYARRITILFSIIMALLAGLYIAFVQLPIRWQSGQNAFYTGLIILPFAALVLLHSDFLRSVHRMFWAYFPAMALRQLLLILLSGLFLLCHGSIAANEILAVLGIVLVIVLLSQWIVFDKHTRQFGSQKKLEKDVWLKVALSLLIFTFGSTVVYQIDFFVVGALMSPYDTGVYGAASKTAMLVGFPLYAINAVVAPMISELYTNKEDEKLAIVVKKAARLTTLGSTMMLVIFFFGGKTLLRLFGAEFVAGYETLLFIGLGHFLTATCGVSSFLLSMTGFQNKCVFAYSLGIVVSLVGSVVFVPIYGYLGAAGAMVFGLLALNITLFVFVKKYLRINPFFI